MGYRFKIVPLVLLALYAFCSVCPERFLPRMALQTASSSEPHDCHKGSKQKSEPECRTAVSDSLPSPTVKFPHVLTLQVFFLPQHDASLALGLLLPPRTTHLSTAGPPIASLNFKLRI
jgi:hypothetical protein